MSRLMSGNHVERSQINDDVVVVNGGELTPRGQLKGTLTVRSDGTAYIYGQVTNLVIEPGATVGLEGKVTGTLTDRRRQL